MALFRKRPARPGRVSRLRPALLLAGVLLAAGAGMSIFRSAAEEARALPAPALDAAATDAASDVVVLAGGCFWGVQGVFQHTTGVTSAVSGYAGGSEASANYEMVSSGRTGHAEAVRITFDPRVVSYGRLLQIFFSVVHDPTELDRQGPDVGPQYRSAIFPESAEQARIAQAYIAQLDQARAFPKPIATKIEPGHAFYPAEDEHQDFMTRYPSHPYIVFHDLPKVAALKRFFPAAWRAEPVLARTAKKS